MKWLKIFKRNLKQAKLRYFEIIPESQFSSSVIPKMSLTLERLKIFKRIIKQSKLRYYKLILENRPCILQNQFSSSMLPKIILESLYSTNNDYYLLFSKFLLYNFSLSNISQLFLPHHLSLELANYTAINVIVSEKRNSKNKNSTAAKCNNTTLQHLCISKANNNK